MIFFSLAVLGLGAMAWHGFQTWLDRTHPPAEPPHTAVLRRMGELENRMAAIEVAKGFQR